MIKDVLKSRFDMTIFANLFNTKVLPKMQTLTFTKKVKKKTCYGTKGYRKNHASKNIA